MLIKRFAKWSEILALLVFLSTLAFSTTPEGKTIEFSGYTWEVKNFTKHKRGPGPNYFSDNRRNVWVDNQGNLHLRIEKREGKWYCAEVYLQKNLGYGYYNFRVREFEGEFDPNVVLGMFIYGGDNKEIDIEISHWGNPEGDNALFTVQPAYRTDHKEDFEINPNKAPMLFSLRWGRDQVDYRVRFFQVRSRGPYAELKNMWAYSGAEIPTAEENLKTRINLWLFKGEPPEKQEEIEVVIERFEFTPL